MKAMSWEGVGTHRGHNQLGGPHHDAQQLHRVVVRVGRRGQQGGVLQLDIVLTEGDLPKEQGPITLHTSETERKHIIDDSSGGKLHTTHCISEGPVTDINYSDGQREAHAQAVVWWQCRRLRCT